MAFRWFSDQGSGIRDQLSSMFKSPKKAIGYNAETLALQFLQKHNLLLLKRNYQTKCGEIDLIMKDKEYTVFVEVKFRQSDQYGDPLHLVPCQKQKRIIRAAKQFLLEKNLYETAYGRFDVIGMLQKDPTKPVEITWIKNAFEVKYT